MGSLVTPLRKIHPTAVVSPGAVIGKNVEIGPYAIIESDVVLGDGCVVMPHAVIYKYTTVGKDCRFFPGCAIGGEPQDLKFADEKTSTVIATAVPLGNAVPSVVPPVKAMRPGLVITC